MGVLYLMACPFPILIAQQQQSVPSRYHLSDTTHVVVLRLAALCCDTEKKKKVYACASCGTHLCTNGNIQSRDFLTTNGRCVVRGLWVPGSAKALCFSNWIEYLSFCTLGCLQRFFVCPSQLFLRKKINSGVSTCLSLLDG